MMDQNRLNKITKGKAAIIALFFLIVSPLLLGRERVKALIPDNIREPLANKIRGTVAYFKRLPDAFDYLYYGFGRHQIKVYEISIAGDDLVELNEYYEEHALDYDRDRYYVRAQLIVDGKKSYDVKVSYRGDEPDHFQFPKKSWRIKSNSQSLIDGKRAINLIVPYDRLFLAEALNNYRAHKIGLPAPADSFVYLYINGRNVGVYYEIEHWTSEMLEKNDLSSETNFYGENGLGGEELYKSVALWQTYVEKPAGYGLPYDDLSVLLYVLNHPSDSYFRKHITDIFDMENFFVWYAHSMFAGSSHQDFWHNARLYFDPTMGKFKFIPWDVSFSSVESMAAEQGPAGFVSYNPLVRRILCEPQWAQAARDAIARYLKGGGNMETDLAWYDTTFEKIKREFFRDSVKNYSNKYFQSEVDRIRGLILSNANYIEKNIIGPDVDWPEDYAQVCIETAGAEQTVELMSADESKSIPDSFAYFEDISKSINDFLWTNPQFKKADSKTLVLGPGDFVFKKNIVIPKNLKVKILPGTRLFFNPGVSILSYSPIEAVGRPDKKIMFMPVHESEPWGTLGIVNSKEVNRFEHAIFRHSAFRPYASEGEDPDAHLLSAGSLNGISFRGMLSIFHGDAVIMNSRFEHANGDDAVDIKSGVVEIRDNVFSGNRADALDIDFSTGEISGNTYENNGNDGLDISGSTLSIVEDKIYESGDKGVSIGEKANIKLEKIIIDGAIDGIAVKDSSMARITDSSIANTTIALHAFQKKQIFSGGSIEYKDLTMKNNTTVQETDNLSKIWEIRY
jgi:hypothetical protein